MTITIVATLVALLALAGIVGFIARRIGVPYPVLLVIVGLVLALIPGIPTLRVEPDLILFVFLPPLVYRGAFHAPIRELIAAQRLILIFAVPGVVITALLVALPVHYVAGLPWSAAFTLGAIVSATDPIAALALFRSLGAPPRLSAIVEGESLINDGTGIVVYRIVIAATMSGMFSLGAALRDFAVVAGGGVLVGLAVGGVAYALLRVVNDAEAEATLQIAVAYGSYLLAEEIHVSGVLATVTAGIVLGLGFTRYSGATARLVGVASWDVLEFIANSLLFLIIGLQLRTVIMQIRPFAPGEVIGSAVVTVVAVILARFILTFGTNLLVRIAHRARLVRARGLPAKWVTVLAWSGLRGGVTLALALGLPLEAKAGQPFPARDLLEFLTYVVVVATLVPTSFLLPPLLTRLGLTGNQESEREELMARRYAARRAREALDRESDADLTPESRQRLRAYYDAQVQRLQGIADGKDGRAFTQWRTVRLRLLEAERDAVRELVQSRRISRVAAERVQRDIDLDAERLTAEED